MLDSRLENKEIGWTVDNAQHNSPIGTSDMYPIIQLIPQGTNGFQRLGDRITPKSLVVRGVIGLTRGVQGDNRPLLVRIVMATQTDVKRSTATNTQGDASHLLRNGTGPADEVPFSGNLLELNYPINNNKFRVIMDKVVELCPVTDSSTEERRQSYYRFTKVIKKLPSHLSFDLANGDAPNNFAPFFAVGYAYADGGSPDLVQTRIFSSVSSILTFEDA